MQITSFLTVFLVFFITFGVAEVPFDFLTPCPVKDDVCIVGLWQTALRKLADGQADLEIPPLDPLTLDNVYVDVPGLVSMQFNGLMKGFKNCIFDKAGTVLKQGRFKESLDLHCNISISGHYDFKVNSSLVLGQKGLIKADGIGKVKLDNLFFKFLMDFRVIKDVDDVVKFVLKDGPISYKYKIYGPVEFSANNIFFGDQNISKLFMPLINQNWKLVMNTFGEPFFNRAIEIVGDFVRAFSKHVPATSYFTDNFETHVQKA